MHTQAHIYAHANTHTHMHTYTHPGNPSALLSFSLTYTHSCCHELWGGQNKQSSVEWENVLLWATEDGVGHRKKLSVIHRLCPGGFFCFAYFCGRRDFQQGHSLSEDLRDPGDHHTCLSVLSVISCGGDYHGELSWWMSLVTVPQEFPFNYNSTGERLDHRGGRASTRGTAALLFDVFLMFVSLVLQKANAAVIILCGY